MTPSERAAAVIAAWDQTPCTTHGLCSEGAECLQAHIAAAIREAVAAETEACAVICEAYAQRVMDADDTGDNVYTAQGLARQIRQRLKAAPDPYGADAPTMTPAAEAAFRRRMNNADRDVD